MIIFDDVTHQNRKEHNPGWLQIRDHSARVLIIRGSGSVKTNALLNLVNHQPDIDKIYIYAKDPQEQEAKFEFLINKRESVGLRHYNDSQAFIEHSIDVDDIYENINDYNPNNKRKIFVMIDGIVSVMSSSSH